MTKTVMLLVTNESDAVIQMTSDGGQKIFTGGMAKLIQQGNILLIRDIEWTYLIKNEHKAAYAGKAFILRLTLRDDEFEIFQTASTLPSSGRIAGSHYLAQGIEISKGPSLRMKMWFGAGDSGLEKGYLRILLRGCFIPNV